MNRGGGETGPEKSPVAWEIAAAVLFVISCFLALSTGLRLGSAGGELLGRALSPFVFALVVIGVFRLFGKARTRRSRAVIAVWTLVVLIFGQFGTLAQQVVPSIEGFQSGENQESAA